MIIRALEAHARVCKKAGINVKIEEVDKNYYFL